MVAAGQRFLRNWTVLSRTGWGIESVDELNVLRRFKVFPQAVLFKSANSRSSATGYGALPVDEKNTVSPPLRSGNVSISSPAISKDFSTCFFQ